MMKRVFGAYLLITSLAALAGEPVSHADSSQQNPVYAGNSVNSAAQPVVIAGTSFATSHGLLAQLQGFIHQRDVDTNHLSADAMVRLMIDWFRFAPIDPPGSPSSADALVYRYGGWSEGCATAFKLSLLRRVTDPAANGGDADRVAGITLIFEPSGHADLAPFSTVSSDWKSIEAFLEAIEASPAFRELAAATPMAVVVESGGLR
jgi:hypothetical protein